MADEMTRALLQSMLSVHSEESGALMNELFRRLIISGLTVSSAGSLSLQPVLVFSLTTPSSPTQGQWWVDKDLTGKIYRLNIYDAGATVVIATVTIP